jgi:glycosyltransferase involved in cell wall biosynthesis
MRIGVDFSVDKSAGGAYQYCLAFLDALSEVKSGDELIVFNYSPDLPAEDYRNNCQILNYADKVIAKDKKVSNPIKKMVYRVLLKVHFFGIIDWATKRMFRERLNKIVENDIDLMIFPAGSQYAQFLKIPYITTIYDLEHRKHPEFPEVSSQGRWLSREHYYKSICRSACIILVDSDVGKQDVVNYYGVDPVKVAILPYLAPNYLQENISEEEAKDALSHRNIPDKYIFYPAQFWPHKNHLNLVKAIEILQSEGIKVSAIFTGTKKAEFGEFQRVQNYINEKSLSDIVRYMGYVSNEEMSAFFKLATAMVMPTFFGPTNIPVLEAWKMGCPVVYSDISGCREQLSNAGLLINPYDPADIAAKIKEICFADSNFRNELIRKGKERLSEWGYSDFSSRVKEIINKLVQEYGTRKNNL